MSGGGLVGARIWSARRGSCVEIQDPITSSSGAVCTVFVRGYLMGGLVQVGKIALAR